MITQVNWDVFKAKFPNDYSKQFEKLCYFLFCNEFNRPSGIPQYSNQVAIEWDPINIGNNIWVTAQAKYTEKLATRETELIDAISKLRSSYEHIIKKDDSVKFHIYSNCAIGQGQKGKPPQWHCRVTQTAKEHFIELVWRNTGYFNSPAVLSSVNADYLKYCFDISNNGLITAIMQARSDTDHLLNNQTRDEINFKNQKIKFNRKEVVNTIYEHIQKKSDVEIIITGTPGVGKSAIIKCLSAKLQDINALFIVLRAEKFLSFNSDELYGYNIDGVLQAGLKDSQKIIIIDSAEYLLYYDNKRNQVDAMLSKIKSHNWQLIFTLRTEFLQEFENIILDGNKSVICEINQISDTELKQLSQNYNFLLPEDKNTLELILTPFYLNEYLKNYNDNSSINKQFKDSIWIGSIQSGTKSRGNTLIDIVRYKLTHDLYGIDPAQFNNEDLKSLHKNGILTYDNKYSQYYIFHDIYEDLASEKMFTKDFLNDNPMQFCEKLNQYKNCNRKFRRWLQYQILQDGTDDTTIHHFIETIIFISNNNISAIKEEIITAILHNPQYLAVWVKKHAQKLLENNFCVLQKFSKLLNLSCKLILTDHPIGYKILCPASWEILIEFVVDNLGHIGIHRLDFFLLRLYEWNQAYEEGSTTYKASVLALEYYERSYLDNEPWRCENSVIDTILYGAFSIKNKLTEIAQEVIANLKNKNNHQQKYNNKYYEIFDRVLDTKKLYDDSAYNLIMINRICKAIPNDLLKICQLSWQDLDRIFTSPLVEQWPDHSNIMAFACELDYHTNWDYNPASALQTPLSRLLYWQYISTTDFLISFINTAVNNLISSKIDKKCGMPIVAREEIREIEIRCADTTNKQYINKYLWGIYRGYENTPELLQSIHMALEKFLLDYTSSTEVNILECYLKKLLTNSISASITAVVTSIVLAHPEKTFNTATILFKIPELIFYDITRLENEKKIKQLLTFDQQFPTSKAKFLFNHERVDSAAMPHRSESLLSLLQKYQKPMPQETHNISLEQRQKIIWDILDQYYNEIENDRNNLYDVQKLLKLLKKVDVRESVKEENSEGKSDNDSTIENYPNTTDLSIQQDIFSWDFYKSNNMSSYRQFSLYEDNPKKALSKLLELLAVNGNSSPLSNSEYVVVIFVLLRDHPEILNSENIIVFADTIVPLAKYLIYNYNCNYDEKILGSIVILIQLLHYENIDQIEIKNLIFLFVIKEDYYSMIDKNFIYFFINSYARIDLHFIESLLLGFIALKPKYEQLKIEKLEEFYKQKNFNTIEAANNFCDSLLKEFIIQNTEDIHNIISDKIDLSTLPEIATLDFLILNSVYQMILPQFQNQYFKQTAQTIIEIFVNNILIENDNLHEKYRIIPWEFLPKYTSFILQLPDEKIEDHLIPFLEHFENIETIHLEQLFAQFITQENSLRTGGKFWMIWTLFLPKIINNVGNRGHDNSIIKYYFFINSFSSNNKEWHNIENQQHFFKEAISQTGNSYSTLYAITKFLQGIGSCYMAEYGLTWIEIIIDQITQVALSSKKYSRDCDQAINNVECFIKSYIGENAKKIKNNKSVKSSTIKILDFLIVHESTLSYQLKNEII